MKIIFHGAANEVGRSCVEVKTKDSKILIDSGIKLTEHGSEYPIEFNVSNVDAAFISHAHLDHTGALPLFNSKGMNCPIYCTAETKEISRILLKDSLHIEMLDNEYPHYDKENIFHVLDNMKLVKYKEEYKFNNIDFKFFDAGHIPGSASILLKIDGANLLYTGDIKTTESELLKPADTNYKEQIDVMITESTYGDREHSSRELEKKKFLTAIRETLKRGGSVLIPAFGVGRAQEIIIMLNELNTGVPIYLDGMAKKVTDLFMQKPEYLKDINEFRAAVKRVEYVYGKNRRKRISQAQAIVVTTSGMMTGGPIMGYMEYYFKDSRHSILLTGYQAVGTNGRMLVETGKFDLEGQIVRVKCKVKKFDFSAHSGLKDLFELIKKVNPKVLLINHGDPGAELHLAELVKKIGIEVHCPNLGDKFEFSK